MAAAEVMQVRGGNRLHYSRPLSPSVQLDEAQNRQAASGRPPSSQSRLGAEFAAAYISRDGMSRAGIAAHACQLRDGDAAVVMLSVFPVMRPLPD
jgi:hypothetical protein